MDATGRRLHTEHQLAWELMRQQVAAVSGHDMGEFPDYEGSEEEQDLDEIERQLSLNPLVRRVAE